MSTLKVNNITDTSGGSTNLTVPNTAKAWVNFNGTGTVAIRASFNVSSITDNGTGDYTVNFTTALADANYSAFGTGSHEDATTNDLRVIFGTVRTTSSARFISVYANGTASYDIPGIHIAIFR